MFKRQRRYSMEEFERRGTELYETKIRSLVYEGNVGRILCIDIESGEYAVADETLDAAQVLIDMNPDAQIWGLRIGYVAVYGFAGFPSREKGSLPRSAKQRFEFTSSMGADSRSSSTQSSIRDLPAS